MDYLLKSMLCLLALLLIHKLLLQREVLHRFNRFFLLGAVLGSFVIPLYTIEVPAEQLEPLVFEAIGEEETEASEFESFAAIENTQSVDTSPMPELVKSEDSESSFPWKNTLWLAYFVISAVFLFRFLRNLGRLLGLIRSNPHLPYQGETLVLIPENQSPFSFLKYIFISRKSFEQEGISDAVFAHERCHVRERHSWDILFVEALMIPFWFHPGLYLARHAIQLNHEFIADQAALSTTSVKAYQEQLLSILLAKSSQPMVSSLNFSLTKKRMQMMNKKSNSLKLKVLVLALIPILAGIGFVFAKKVSPPLNVKSQGSEKVYSFANNTVFKGMPMEEYLSLYGKIQTKVYENRFRAIPTPDEIEKLRMEFDLLNASYLKLSLEERRQVKRPQFPYAKLEKDGKVIYKKFEDLTEEEKKNLGC